MTTSLLRLRLRQKRDLLVCRQRVRQVARMLGCDPLEQATLAGVVFELLLGRWSEIPRLLVELALEDTAFEIHLRPAKGERTPATLLARQPLKTRPPMAPADLRWAVRELDNNTPLNLLEEFRQLNSDLLRAALELQRLRRSRDSGQPEHAA